MDGFENEEYNGKESGEQVPPFIVEEASDYSEPAPQIPAQQDGQTGEFCQQNPQQIPQGFAKDVPPVQNTVPGWGVPAPPRKPIKICWKIRNRIWSGFWSGWKQKAMRRWIWPETMLL